MKEDLVAYIVSKQELSAYKQRWNGGGNEFKSLGTWSGALNTFCLLQLLSTTLKTIWIGGSTWNIKSAVFKV